MITPDMHAYKRARVTGWRRSAAAGIAGFSLAPALAGGFIVTLHGRVSDTSDNWLPGVEVRARHASAVARTDGNGLFTIDLPMPQPPAPAGDGVLEYLELRKDGYRTQTVPIRDQRDLEGVMNLRMEPEPVLGDTWRVEMPMRRSATVHGLPRLLGLEVGALLSPEQIREALERVARRGSEATEPVRFFGHVPPGVERLRAVFLISLHGMGSIDHPVLRAFAAEAGLALVGVEGGPVQRGAWPVHLLDAPLQELGRRAGHTEIPDLPVLTFGHSNGTGFATVYAAERPERLIAWISYHSGYGWQLQMPGVEQAPGLVLHGHLDAWLRHGQEQAVADLRRERNAPVAMMIEGNVGHGPVDTAATWRLVVEFCHAALRTRLNADGTLRPVAIEEGWLGAVYDRAMGGQQRLPIAPYAEYPGDRTVANWLPDRSFAEAWRQYGETDPRGAAESDPMQ